MLLANGEVVAESAPAPVIEETAPVVTAPVVAKKIETTSNTGKFYSPLVRSIAQKEGVSLNELEAIAGSGKGGRVTKKDILNYIPNRTQQAASAPVSSNGTAKPAVKSQPAPVIQSMGGDEIIEMDRMRKLIADHMVMSKQTSPHVTSYVEADMTNIVNWRNRVKDEFLARENEKNHFYTNHYRSDSKSD